MSNLGSGLSLLEMSTVRELANIGLGHAATAMSNLTGLPTNIEVPLVETVALDDVPEFIGASDSVAVAVYVALAGEVEGHAMFLFPWSSAQTLWTNLLGNAPADPSEVSELEASAILEIGNILSGSFTSAISEMAMLDLHVSPPLVSIDTGYSIVSSVVAEAEANDIVGLAIETKLFATSGQELSGFFVCLPSMSGLRLIFERLGVAEAA